LHPETPVGGMLLSELFPGRRVAEMQEQLKGFAAGFGISNMGAPSCLPNTRRALAIAELARDAGKLDVWRTAAMEAHWRRGRDLENVEHLRALAVEVGLDADAAIRSMDDAHYLGRVDALRHEASELGVTGIPTFVFGNLAVVGCQSYEVLARVAVQAGARPRARS
jgi:predicted DsbA family dithiol-disulfide isomerase